MKTLIPLFAVIAFVVFTPLAPGQSPQATAQTQATLQQTSTSSATEETATSTRKPFIISPSGTIELPNGTTTHLKAAITEPPEGLRHSVSGVQLNGYIGYVLYQGKNLMVTVIDTVSKGQNTVAMPRRIEAQEYRDKTVLTSDDEINVEVDPAELDSALDELANMARQEQEAGDKEGQRQERPDAPSSTPTAGGVSGTGTYGTGTSHYQNPAQRDFQDEDDPKVEVKTTTDGCEVRVDQNQLVAIQQNKTQTYEDGKLASESECIDSEVRYPLQKSFDGCSDIVDVNALTAYRQSKTYYNRNGARVTVSGCAKDTGATYRISEDSESCAPVVNRSTRQVTIYARLIYTGSNNAVINVRACAPSATQPAYNLKKSYDSCGHKVDVPNKYAYGQYKDYYVNKVGTRVEVSDCAVDTSKKWAITEHEGSCKVLLDFTAGEEKAFKQSVLKYTDDKAVEHEARGCDKSTLSAGVTIVRDTAQCAIRHDFDEGRSYEQYIWKYTLDNVTYQASACSDTGMLFAHTKYTVDSTGARVCQPHVDTQSKLVTLYYRIGITVKNAVRYISECTPDSQNTLAVVATTDGCTDPAAWQHNLSAAVSYENERWYYDFNGKREYVTPCQQGSKTYQHKVTTIGWQLHDDKLYAYPISKVTIDAPIGEYVVSLNTVLPGTVQQPYVFQETKDIVPDKGGNPNSVHVPDRFEGCTGFFNTERTEIYKRPDATQYLKVVGSGDPVTEDVCNRINETRNVHVGYTAKTGPKVTLKCYTHRDDGRHYTKEASYVVYGRIFRQYTKAGSVNKYTNKVLSMSYTPGAESVHYVAPNVNIHHLVDRGEGCSSMKVTYPDSFLNEIRANGGFTFGIDNPTYFLTDADVSW